MEIPGYKIEKQIGKGGMARVFLATHLGLDRKVAIKVMNRQLDEDDTGFSDRFMREARIVANLTHQNIVTVYDVGSHEGYNYIAMEYLPGGVTLDHKIKQGIELAAGINTIKQIAAALGFAHSRQPPIVHRDVKPENIMYREDGSAVLTDFGIARASNSVTKMTATGTVIGTPHYMSPEQAQGHEIGAFSDIYSLGVVFYEMLTGKVPYDADSTIAVVFKHITEPVPTLEGDLAVYQHVLDRMMAKDKAERYAHCEEIVTDLDAITGVDLGATLVNATPRPRPASASAGTTIGPAATVINTASQARAQDETGEADAAGSRGKFVIAGIAVVALAAIAGGGYLYVQQAEEQERLAAQQQQETERAREAKLADQQKLQRQQASQAEAEQARLAEQQRLAEQRKKDEQQARLAAEEQARASELEKEREAKAAATARAREEKQRKITTLLATAEKQLTDTQLANAYRTFNEVLKIDSRNQRAKGGITRVGDRYLALASTAARGYDFDKANDYIKAVIQADPTHNKLADTQTLVFNLKNEQLAQEAEQKRLAEEAAKQKQAASQPTVDKEPDKKIRTFGGF